MARIRLNLKKMKVTEKIAKGRQIGALEWPLVTVIVLWELSLRLHRATQLQLVQPEPKHT